MTIYGRFGRIAAAVTTLCAVLIGLTSATPVGAGGAEKANIAHLTAAQLPSVKLVLGWVPSPEFAGFYAAEKLGFYKEYGLNVKIQAGGPNVNAEQLTGAGSGQFGTDDFGNMLASNGSGTNLVALAQLATRPALVLMSMKSKHINGPKDWRGKTIGVFAGDNPLYATFRKYGINQHKDVKLVEQGANMNQFTSGEIDLASGFLYNEVGQVIASGIPRRNLNLYNYTSDGTATLEDSIFGNGAYVASHPQVAAELVAGSIKGWAYCRKNPRACVRIVTAAGSEDPQKFALWSMNTINSLWWPAPNGFGRLNSNTAQRTVNILYQGGVLKSKPNLSQVLDTAVYQAAVKLLGPSVNLKAGYRSIKNLKP